MKKLILFCLVACAGILAQAQDVPYAKYLNYTQSEFKENKFKYDNETNTWSIRKVNGLNVALNIFAFLADAEEDVRPHHNDYRIVVQFGREEKASYIKVEYYNDETFHKLLTFMKDNCEDFIETNSGKLTKYQGYCGDYAIELNMKQHTISRTSARTFDHKAVKNVDESYNEYEFIIRTNVEPWSKHIEKEAEKKAKRDAKGKKKSTVDEMM